ncbi:MULTISPECIES: hypothetical protein [unclassified Streptomyces]|uniref:hypothetical protein n=1 Tax=unclassified Streptomyces TaxID=2593676 RepID=UPI0011703C2A|nr:MULTISPECIES: hypothetical protein [unclassified Streptomyces]MDI1457425.1 hypothetical protein [Streptomyces sp. ATE26]GEJ97853.1 hypothetical protein TNCT1_01300 [Streptomyces sp. 1-11]
MPSFRTDLSTAVVFVASAPAPKPANARTGERAMDRDRRAVGCLSDPEKTSAYLASVA